MTTPLLSNRLCNILSESAPSVGGGGGGLCVCVCIPVLAEASRSVTDLRPTGLAFGRLKLFWLGYKSTHTCEPFITRDIKATCVILS